MQTEQKLIHIAPETFLPHAFSIWDKTSFLLTAGDFAAGKFNPMAVGWGFFGVMWGRPVAIAAVRPQRHTMQFLEEFESFTLTALPVALHEKLIWCGRNSGADGTDKFAASGLTPTAAETVAAPAIAEAELSIECRMLYKDALRGKNFLEKSMIRTNYPDADFHVMFYGEILNIRGIAAYRG